MRNLISLKIFKGRASGLCPHFGQGIFTWFWADWPVLEKQSLRQLSSTMNVSQCLASPTSPPAAGSIVFGGEANSRATCVALQQCITSMRSSHDFSGSHFPLDCQRKLRRPAGVLELVFKITQSWNMRELRKTSGPKRGPVREFGSFACACVETVLEREGARSESVWNGLRMGSNGPANRVPCRHQCKWNLFKPDLMLHE